jgi:hypothetical protein
MISFIKVVGKFPHEEQASQYTFILKYKRGEKRRGGDGGEDKRRGGERIGSHLHSSSCVLQVTD